MTEQILPLHDHKPTLDGLRGIACLLVVYSHITEVIAKSSGLDGSLMGAFGVVIFFALSGFLMGYLYLFKPYSIDNGVKYLIARFTRITPAYYIAILVYLAIDLTLDQFYDMGLINTLRCFAYICSVGVFWSIGPEIQFYIYFLAIWFCAHYALQKKNYIPTAILAVFTAGLIATRTEWPGILLPSKLHLFLFGVGSAALLKHDGIRKIISTLVFQIAIAAASLLYLHFFITNENVFVSLPFAAICAVMIASLSATTFATSPLQLSPMRFLGAASFSIYLFHGPVIRIFDYYILSLNEYGWPAILLVAVLAVAIPSLFYLAVEKKLNIFLKEYFLNTYAKFKNRKQTQGKIPA